MFYGKIHYKWPFSIAMLGHQRVMPQKRRFCKPDCGFLPEQTAMSPNFRTLAHSTAMIFSCGVNYMPEKKKTKNWFTGGFFNSIELHIGFRKKKYPPTSTSLYPPDSSGIQTWQWNMQHDDNYPIPMTNPWCWYIC